MNLPAERKAPTYKFGPVEPSEVIQLTDPSGNSMDVVPVLGHMWWPLKLLQSGVIPDQRFHYQTVKQMAMRHNDVLICSFPKSGTHWVWEIAIMLLRGKAEYERTPKEASMFDFHLPGELDEISSPRVLNSHYEFDLLPEDLKSQKCKIIYIERNPKDVAVSFYTHVKNSNICSFEGSWNDYLSTFLGDKCLFFNWFRYTKTWQKAIEDNSHLPILQLSYENLIKNPVEEVTKIATFLEVTVSNELIEDICDKCTFANMKEAHETLKRDRYGNKPNRDKIDYKLMYRKGKVGDWKDVFTVAQNEFFDEHFDKIRPKSENKYIFSLET